MSLLDSMVLMDIANSGLDVTPRAKRRPHLGENFELLLTVTNLRGVPYAFEVTGQNPASLSARNGGLGLWAMGAISFLFRRCRISAGRPAWPAAIDGFGFSGWRTPVLFQTR